MCKQVFIFGIHPHPEASSDCDQHVTEGMKLDIETDKKGKIAPVFKAFHSISQARRGNVRRGIEFDFQLIR